MSIDLIETRSGHGKVLAALHERCFEQAWSAEEFERLLALPNSAGVICLSPSPQSGDGDSSPVGFLLCQFGGGSCDILTICVLPERRRAGFAGALLREFERRGPTIGISDIFLEVAEDNAAAIAFYQRQDYFEVGRRRNYYKRGSRTCDALVFQHVLA
ncbi:MAG: N-acetyltransferase [Proteobacteria bacterium]|nr:N-acetyltransferase [Pseudomonadota bacterium]